MLSNTNSDTNLSINELLERFSKGSIRQRKSLVASVEARATELVEVGPELLLSFDPNGDDWAPGWILQVLKRHHSDFLLTLLPEKDSGWFRTESSRGIDYGSLQENFLCENFEEADRFTSAVLRQLAGPEAEQRGYVYFSEVPSMSGKDLVTLDRLWTVYSQGKYGFSKQASLLGALDGRYDLLWPRIGWKKEGVWTRYPSSFDWTLNAPEGHMPLVNQLRGVRLIDALLNHPALVVRREGSSK